MRFENLNGRFLFGVGVLEFRNLVSVVTSALECPIQSILTMSFVIRNLLSLKMPSFDSPWRKSCPRVEEKPKASKSLEARLDTERYLIPARRKLFFHFFFIQSNEKLRFLLLHYEI